MFTKEDKKKIIMAVVVAFIAIVIFHMLDNFTSTLAFLSQIGDVATPITAGFVVFYIVNIPMTSVEKHIFKKFKGPNKIKRGLSLLMTLLFIGGFLTIFVLFAFPQLVDSVDQLVEQVPTQAENVGVFFDQQLSRLDVSDEVVSEAEAIWTDFIGSFANVLLLIVNSAGSLVTSILSGVFTAVLSLVLAIYMLLGKERLASTFSKLFRAYAPKKFIEPFVETLEIINHSFENFIRGQLLEALIIGVICYIGMKIFGFEYALLISFFVGITNVIPIFGPYIGAVPSMFLLLMVNPMHALWFILYVIALQQIEGNLIYPRVVGDAMGISGFWIMVAVIVGNSFFGIPGILLGIPLLSSAYIILRETTNNRLALRKDSEEKLTQEEVVEVVGGEIKV